MINESSPEPGPAAFDASRLTELFQDDFSSIADVLHTAFDSLRELLERLATQLRAGNRQESIALIHELKGVSSNIGAEELAALGRALETELRNSESLNTATFQRGLELAYNRFVAQARGYLDRIQR